MAAAKAMSEKQEAFIRSLVQDRELDAELKSRLVETLESQESPTTSKQASLMIKWLLTQPRKPRELSAVEAAVPEGHYAVVEDGEVRCFRVDKPAEGQWAGWCFVRESPGGKVTHERKDAVLALVAADVKGAAAAFAKMKPAQATRARKRAARRAAANS